jgi:hypothetical protein
MKLAACLTLSALALIAADPNIAGRWTGDVVTTSETGQHTEYPFVLTLKQDGGSFSGTMGPAGGKPLSIRDARLDGGNLTFAVQSDEVDVKFDLALDGDHLKGNIAGKDRGQAFTGTIDLSRSK